MSRLAFLILALLSLAACGPATVPEPTSTTPAPAEEPDAGTPDAENAQPTPQAEATAAAGEPRYAGAAPTPASLGESVAASLGDPEAPVTIVEFTDYECPFCGRYSRETFPQIREQLVETGIVYYQLKDLPLEMHPSARIAAQAARCAGDQEAYWEMHDALFADQEVWSQADDVEAALNELAGGLELDAPTFADCLESGKYAEAVANNLSEATALGVTGAPSFFIDGYPVRGAQPFALFEYAVGLAQEGTLADAYRQPLPEVDDGAFALGDPDAPVVLVEFTDYQCPFCARHATETMPLIVENYVETGSVYYVVKDFPLQQIHPNALLAAQAARCAGDQDAYLGMHDLLFERQDAWSNEADAAAAFATLAGELELDADAFSACLANGEYEDEVLANFDEGAGIGVSGTPAFFVGTEFVDGAQPYEVFVQVLESQLEQAE